MTDKKLPHAIFLDIDGTLMSGPGFEDIKGGFIPQKNLEVISAARKLGHKVLINTGRGYSCIPACCEAKNLDIDGYVSALGAYIEMGGKVIYSLPIPKDLVSELVDFSLSTGFSCRFQGPRAAIGFTRDTAYPSFWKPLFDKKAFFDLLGDEIISKVTIDSPITDAQSELLSKKLKLFNHGRVVEVVMPACDKAKGMKIVLDALGIPVERSIAMGDSINDLDALMFAGRSVAMGNAPEKIKNLCDFVTDDAASGGVGKAIEDLLL